MSERLIQGIVRVLDANGSTAGTGFVLSETGLIVTCSHVLQHETDQQRGYPRPEKVSLVFYATDEKREALVESKWWRSWEAEDLAILQVEGSLPSGIHPLLLGSAQGTNGHQVGTLGFPAIGDVRAIGADGQVVFHESERSLLQLRSDEITVGFSGAPVWDHLRRRVIGMVSAIAKPDPHGRLVTTAFAIPTETLREICPTLDISEVCPYRGLAAFREADAEFFFGRQETVERLLDKLHGDPRFLLVLGPSGSGKSSVVQAGLIPQLKSGKLLNSEHWGIIVMRPASNPFEELAKQGMADGRDLTEQAGLWLEQHGKQKRLMLVVDQFEEVFSLCPEAMRQDFITQLANLLHSPFPLTVVLVMRDDFYARLTQQEGLVEWLEQSQSLVHVQKSLKRDALIAIVQKPLEAVGIGWEKGLVDVIVKDTMETSGESQAHGQAGRSVVLPLLESALTELWKKCQEGILTHEAYRSSRGVAGALTQWADQALATLKEKKLARRILTDLVHLGDKSQGIPDSRRRRTFISLCRNESERQSIQQVVQHLVENRLLVTDRDLQSSEGTVEIIHDVLLQEWGQLKKWLAEDHRFLTWHQEFERLAQRWVSKREQTKLFQGDDLTEAKGWLKKRRTDLSQDEIAFIGASRAQRLQFIMGLVAVLLLLGSLTITTGWYAFHQPPDPRRVTNLDNDGGGSLRWAIANAPDNSTVTFDQDLRGQTLLLTSDLPITKKRLSIRGPDEGKLTISNKTHQIHVFKNASITLVNLIFTGSQSNSLSLLLNEGTLTLSNSTVSGNTSHPAPGFDDRNANGGGIQNTGTLSLINSTVSGNTAQGGPQGGRNSAGIGGGIANFGMLMLTNSTASGNSVFGTTSYGGGIANYGTLTLTNSTVSDNTATSRIDSSITNWMDQSFGGGIYSDQTLTLINSMVSDNTAPDGGGIENGDGGTFTMMNSTVSGNTASGSNGGGIDNYGTLTLTNSTISGNTVLYKGFNGGGGIYNLAGKVTITFCTIYGNSSYNGGGIYNEETPYVQEHGYLRTSKSLVAGNHAPTGPDIAGSIISEGYNLFQNISGVITQKTDISGDHFSDLHIDPKLQKNNGTTLTHALLPGSPAIDVIPIDACHINGITTDQRGINRPQGMKCDIGAYEWVS